MKFFRFLPGIVLFGVLVLLWASTATPLSAAALYTIAFVWSVSLPGVAVARVLSEPRSLFEDLAVGTAIGLVLQLAAWAVFTTLGIQAWLVLWPLLTLIPVALLPKARARVMARRYPQPLRFVTAWSFAVACLLALVNMAAVMGSSALPPAANSWYQDDYWHLALSAALKRSVPPEMPQVAGETFFYHWYANAHVATMAHTTGIDLPIVFTRLWMPFVVFTGLAMVVVVGRALTGRYWPGVLAALLAGCGGAIRPGWFTLFGTSVFNEHSPSQQFSIALMMLALLPLVQVARGQRLRAGEWVFLVLGALGCSGAKSSVLPVLVCGLLLASAVSLLFNRTMLRRLLPVLAVTLGIMVLTLPLTSGGSAGVKLQLFASIRGTQPWARMLGGVPPVSVESIPPGLERAGAPLLLVLLLVAYVVAYGWLMGGIATLNRRDLSGWLLFGIGIAGWSAMMLINQDGFSQVYFMNSAILAWYLLAGMGMVRAWQGGIAAVGGERATSAAVLGGVAGWGVVSVTKHYAGAMPDAASVNTSVVLALAPVAGVMGLVLVAIFSARFAGRDGWAAVLWLGLNAGLVGAALQRVAELGEAILPEGHLVIPGCFSLLGLFAAFLLARPRERLFTSVIGALVVGTAFVVGWASVSADASRSQHQADLAKPRTVTAEETQAARWLNAHSDIDDIVATNVHCLDKQTRPNCDARAFWVGAFTERRVLVEGWAYTAEAHQAHGVGGLSYARQPFHDQELFYLNERVFTHPTVEGLTALRSRGVRWLYADRAAGPVAPGLANLADVAYEKGGVTLYRLR